MTNTFGLVGGEPVSPSAFAPSGATYVTLTAHGSLSSERVLTGTVNQITLTDNGAGSTLVLSLPQDIATTSSPTFAGARISGLTASRPLKLDASKNLVATQINLGSTGDVTGTLPTTNGGTGLSSWDAGAIPFYVSGSTLTFDLNDLYRDPTSERFGFGVGASEVELLDAKHVVRPGTNCNGTPDTCDTFGDQGSCETQGCTWEQNGGCSGHDESGCNADPACSWNPGNDCSGLGDQGSCEAEDGCTWTPANDCSDFNGNEAGCLGEPTCNAEYAYDCSQHNGDETGCNDHAGDGCSYNDPNCEGSAGEFSGCNGEYGSAGCSGIYGQTCEESPYCGGEPTECTGLDEAGCGVIAGCEFSVETAGHWLGAGIIDGSLDVGGALTVDGAASVGNGLSVTGATTLSSLTVNSSLTANAGLAIGGTFQLSVASPSQITSNQNNYNPSTASYWRLSSNASRDITGINASNERLLIITNVGSQNIVFKHQSTSSTAGNRFLFSTGADITLVGNQTLTILYDRVTQRWRDIALR